ncbi:hypothetical protein ES707_20388 [subsurface metagenome]
MKEAVLTVQLSELRKGKLLPEIVRVITQENINLYAKASKDLNPIHVDEDFARKAPLKGTVAHGMLVLAYVSQMMTAAFGQSWLVGGQLDVRFKNPARPGDTLTISGKIHDIDKNEVRTLINCDVRCRNQRDESIIIGTAKVTV